MPLSISHALMALPQCMVHISHRLNWNLSVFTYDSVQSLVGLSGLLPLAAQLSTLGVIIPLNSRPLLEKVGELISISPVLKVLRIHGAKRMNSDGVWFESTSPSVGDCRWLAKDSQTRLSCPRLKQLELFNFCVCDSRDWEQWEKIIPWPSITHLWLNCPSFISRLGPKLHDLTHLTLQIDYLDSNSSHYYIPCCSRVHSSSEIKFALMQCHGLRELYLLNRMEVVDEELLSHIGSTITKLFVEEMVGLCKKSPFSVGFIKKLASDAPGLQEFMIDIPEDESLVGTPTPSWDRKEDKRRC